jgi:hypothetical protein
MGILGVPFLCFLVLREQAGVRAKCAKRFTSNRTQPDG